MGWRLWITLLIAQAVALGWTRVDAQQVERTQFRRVVTIAGNGNTGRAVEQGRALDVPLSNPFGVQVEADGSLVSL